MAGASRRRFCRRVPARRRSSFLAASTGRLISSFASSVSTTEFGRKSGEIYGGAGVARKKRGGVRLHAPSLVYRPALLQVLVDELRHLEHRDAALATEDRLELLVGDDHAALLRILEAVPLDVRPELLGDFRARHTVVADDGAERSTRLHRLHERGIRFTLRAALLLRATALRGFLRFLGALLFLCGHSLSR